MTAIGVTNQDGSPNPSTNAHGWKRRAERVVRASGHPYTILRPGWFDYNDADQQHLHFVQVDRRWAGSAVDGMIACSQIAALDGDRGLDGADDVDNQPVAAEPASVRADLDHIIGIAGR